MSTEQKDDWTLRPEALPLAKRDPMPELTWKAQRCRSILEGILSGKLRNGKQPQGERISWPILDGIRPLAVFNPGSVPPHHILELQLYYNERIANTTEKINWTFDNALVRIDHPGLPGKILSLEANDFMDEKMITKYNEIFVASSVKCRDARKDCLFFNNRKKLRELLKDMYMTLEKLYDILLQAKMEKIYASIPGANLEHGTKCMISNGKLHIRNAAQPFNSTESYRLSEPFLDFQDKTYLQTQRFRKYQETLLWNAPLILSEQPAWDQIPWYRYFHHPHRDFHYPNRDWMTEDRPQETITREDMVGGTPEGNCFAAMDQHPKYHGREPKYPNPHHDSLVCEPEQHFRSKIMVWIKSIPDVEPKGKTKNGSGMDPTISPSSPYIPPHRR
ncbi:hypothetical protein BJ878DRAFT_477252 [Calycina marina]|uniref:Uncharacterized protein n=1 Tax=Calycina marina TaxID=1763456 RepID=A0A9P7Z9Y4_9HELO|nr:hypothetical protein BJ878DRAFT_477252 [Calycina marina]